MDKKLDNYSPKNIKLEEIAQKYVQKIETVQKEGSYNIIGWCIGGSIAFEIALQLEKRGKELSFFGMINSFAPDREFWGEVPEFTISTEEDEIGNLPEYSTFKKKYNKFDSIQDIWTKLLKLYEEIELPVEKLKKYVYDDMDRAIPNFDAENIKVQDIVYYINVLRTFDNVRALYMPTRKLKTQCYFFMATEEAAANALLWNKYCEEKIDLYNIEGNNFSVLRYPGVLDFSAILNEILEFKGEYK
ncbi:thioesterase domain-containing protein [Lacrimispora sp.]|uniref:thioesterase domain-containing protein n=1 Tax=Lacrimispora sp. TaxID=2719234 RepID=UPI0028AB1551|nr:thioesterase domain-containing protein [Lacrimispora sp.]